MTWPASDVDTTDMDAGTDSPLTARSDLHDLATKFNQLRNHVTAYIQGLLTAVDAVAARTTLGLGSAAVEPVTTFWSTGDLKTTLKTIADAGWIFMNDLSIGNASSGATGRANADTAALFTLIWTNVNNTWAPLQDSAGTPTARGGSAAADYAANRRLVLPKALGREMAISGSGAGLTARVLGETLGVETITTAHLPASGLSVPSLSIPSLTVNFGGTSNPSGGSNGNRNAYTGDDSASPIATSTIMSGGASTSASGTGGGTTGNMGSGGTFANPKFHVNVMVKL